MVNIMAGTLYQTNGTLAGVDVTINILTSAAFAAKVVVLMNDSPGNDYTVTMQGTSTKLKAGEVSISTGDIKKVVLNGTGDYRLFASEDAEILPTLLKPPGIVAGAIVLSDLTDGIFAASAAGRLKFADDFWDATSVSTVGAGGKFATDCITATGSTNLFAADSIDNTFVQKAFAVGAIGADANSRAAIADDFINSTMLSAAGAGGIISANALTTAGIQNMVADDAFTSAEFAAGAGGKFAANCLVTAGIQNLIADDAFTAAEFAAGAGGKFAPNCLVTAGLQNLIADDAFTAAEFAVGAGGKFAANCLVTAGIQNLIADDAVTAAEFAPGAGGKFAADCLTAANTNNLFAVDSVDNALVQKAFAAGCMGVDADSRAVLADDYFSATMVSEAAVGGKFAANAITEAGLTHLVTDDAFSATIVSTVGAGGKFAADCFTATGTNNAFATNSLDSSFCTNKIADGAIPHGKLEVGAAAAGLVSRQVQFTAAQTAGVGLTAATLPVILELAIADAATGDDDFLSIIGKHKVINCWVDIEAAGDAANTYQLQTGAGVAISDAITPGAADGSIGRCANLASGAGRIIASGATVRVHHVRNAGSSLAKFYVEMVPVA